MEGRETGCSIVHAGKNGDQYSGHRDNEKWLDPVVAMPALSCPEACGILVPQPGMEPECPELKGRF